MNTGQHRAMRRANREVTERSELKKIIKQATVLRVGATDAEGMFIVPMSYGFEWKEGSELPVFWLHSATEGRKADAWRANPSVALELDVPNNVIVGDFACAYSLAYRSIMAEGRVTAVTDAAEKRHGLKRLMKHVAPGAPVEFSDEALERVSVWRVDVTRLTGKERAGVAAPASHAAGFSPAQRLGEAPATAASAAPAPTAPKLSKKERQRAVEKALRGEHCPGCGAHCKLYDPSCGKGKKLRDRRLEKLGLTELIA